jgi:hypothetical protein
MARVTIFDPQGKVGCVSSADEYDEPSSAALKKILARLLNKGSKGEGDDEDLDPESAKEEALRDLVELHPEVLPWEAWSKKEREDGTKILPDVLWVSRGAGGIPVDVLLLETWRRVDGSYEARFGIVETKLARNPEINRTVLGQVIEYGAGLAAFLAPEDGAKRLLKSSGPTFEGRANAKFGGAWRETLWASACANARRGDIRLLIVADSIPWSLCQALSFVRAEMLIGAVEVTFHQGDTGGLAVGALVAETQGGDVFTKWKTWAGSLKLSLATVRAITGQDVVVATAVPTSNTRSRIGSRKTDIAEILKASSEEWRPILEDLRKMLDDLGSDCLEPESGKVFISYKVPALEKKMAVVRLAKDSLVLRTSYIESSVKELEKKQLKGQAQQLAMIANNYRQGLKDFGFLVDKNGKYTVRDAARLRDHALRQSLVDLICQVARDAQTLA